MELDERLRARLKQLAEREPAQLAESARARIRVRVLERAGAGRSGHRAAWLALPAFGLALMLLWLQRVEPNAAEPRTPLPRELPAERGRAPENSTAAAPSESNTPACQEAAQERAAFVAKAGDELLELPRARVVFSPARNAALSGSSSRLVALHRCELGLSLTGGELTVHARDLQGGSLWIDTPLGRVQVRGTIFSVLVESGRTRIAVVEGRVAVQRAAGMWTEVEAGQVLDIAAAGAVQEQTLSPRERTRLLTRLGLSSRPRSNASQQMDSPPPAEAGAEVERVWHEGAIQSYAPEQPEVPSSLQPDGRPMQKPRVIP